MNYRSQLGTAAAEQVKEKINFIFLFLGLFYGFIDSTAEDMTGNRERKRGGSDTQQRDLSRESNPGPLQSLSTWDTRSTN